MKRTELRLLIKEELEALLETTDTTRLANAISNSIDKIDRNLDLDDLTRAIAVFAVNKYGMHAKRMFLRSLIKNLDKLHNYEV